MLYVIVTLVCLFGTWALTRIFTRELGRVVGFALGCFLSCVSADQADTDHPLAIIGIGLVIAFVASKTPPR